MAGWKYADLERDGIEPANLMCTCGHIGEGHHGVWWPLGMTLDECEFFGFNEKGGMMPDPEGEGWVNHCHHFTESKAL